MSKKIGILTLWNVPNYGTFLQAYSLQKFISSINTDYEVKQISYLEKKHFNIYYGLFNNLGYKHPFINPKFYYHFFKQLITLKARKQKIKELSCFLDYYNNFISHTDNYDKDKLEAEKFDEVVVGSDIIWDYTISFFNHDVYLFGNNLNTDKVLSYAASFGTVKSGLLVPEYVKSGLSKMSAISVRDKNSQKIVKEISGKESTIVCDPTFLWDFINDKNIDDCEYKDYIIVYGSEFNDNLIKEARDYVSDKHLKLICLDSLDDSFTWCDLNIKQNNINPFQWLSFFKHAKAIMTCTYHGLMFGLIFNKPIVFNPTQFIMDKASSLIAYLELEEPLIHNKTFTDKINWLWDYNSINERINELRKLSIDFLKKSL